MILKKIIAHIDTKLEELDYFGRNIFGLCEQIDFEDQKYPAYFDGEHKQITLDENQTYCRKTGMVRIRNIDSDTSTDDCQERTYPVRVVAHLLRRDIEAETIYSGDYLADIIINKLSANNIKTLSQSIDADTVSIQPESYNTNPFEVWADEFRNVAMNADYTERLLIAIDFEITITGALPCFEL